MAPTASSSKKAPAMKTLKTTLRSLLNMFQDICGFAENLSEVTSASQVTVRLEKLDELWEKVNEMILDIETHDDHDEKEDDCFKQRSAFGSKYYDLKSLLLDKVKEFEEPAVLKQSTRSLDTSHQPIGEHVRLPRIMLQTFDGNIDDWLTFLDLFISLIHRNVELWEVEKFHFLKGCLAGEAKALVDPLVITRANYQIAWDTSMKRYNDSKQLKRCQIQALFKLPKLTVDSRFAVPAGGIQENCSNIGPASSARRLQGSAASGYLVRSPGSSDTEKLGGILVHQGARYYKRPD
ncbi:uncharacterized protein LOC134209452 [Armigeres subalbatus]|uniref:uncharacterized protein LOC134209452 n=1 Tax=Armigeres subalbatus TaxID=124917 RepID=UPI002ED3511A